MASIVFKLNTHVSGYTMPQKIMKCFRAELSVRYVCTTDCSCTNDRSDTVRLCNHLKAVLSVARHSNGGLKESQTGVAGHWA